MYWQLRFSAILRGSLQRELEDTSSHLTLNQAEGEIIILFTQFTSDTSADSHHAPPSTNQITDDDATNTDTNQSSRRLWWWGSWGDDVPDGDTAQEIQALKDELAVMKADQAELREQMANMLSSIGTMVTVTDLEGLLQSSAIVTDMQDQMLMAADLEDLLIVRINGDT